MSEEAEAYRKIYFDNIEALRRGEIEADAALLGPASDDRVGISLVVPLPSLAPRYEELARAFREAEPGLYLYPPGDLHVTVFDFAAGRADYRPDAGLEVRIERICARLAFSLAGLDIEFRGVVFGRAAGLIKGYADGRLGSVREALRAALAQEGIPNTERYPSQTAHATFCRFAGRPRDPERLCRLAEAWGETAIGAERPAAFLLVEHDWYNRAAGRRLIAEL